MGDSSDSESEGEDLRLEYIRAYTCNALRIKPIKWNSFFSYDDAKNRIYEFLDEKGTPGREGRQVESIKISFLNHTLPSIYLFGLTFCELDLHSKNR